MSKLSDAENRLNPLPMKRHKAGKPLPITIAQEPTMSEPKTMSAKPKTPREFYPKSGSYFLHSQKQDIFAFAAAYHAHELARMRAEIEAKIATATKVINSFNSPTILKQAAMAQSGTLNEVLRIMLPDWNSG